MFSGTLTTTGELYGGVRHFSNHDEPEFLALIKMLRDADVAFTHIETTINNFEGWQIRGWTGFPLQSDPIIADDLKWAGIDVVSCAANHTYDYGAAGIEAEMKELDRAGIVWAGIGMNLQEAREPHYFESRSGRVAIISISSGHNPYDSAGLANPPVLGRPGVNPLRVHSRHILDHDTMAKFKEVLDKMNIHTGKPRHLPLIEGEFDLEMEYIYESYEGMATYVEGDKNEIVQIPNPWDVQCIMRSIKEAKREADLVLLAHHVASSDGARGSKPATFVPPFVKSCIDVGVDAYLGTGWHKTLGMEIYKKKPIFYGMGNFFSQYSFLKRLPADTYEGVGFNLDNLTAYTPADFHDLRHDAVRDTRRLMPNIIGGYISNLTFDKGDVTELKIIPFEYGADIKIGIKRVTGSRLEGRPMLASRDNANFILDDLAKLSAELGTTIENKDGTGVVKL